MESVSVSSLPFELTAGGPAGARWSTDGTTVEMVSAEKSDLFIDPTAAPGQASADLTRLTGAVTGPFQLSARVTVDFKNRFDAGVLVVWVNETTWLKLCFEFSPGGRGSVVSVVTRSVSDDANSWDVVGETVYLRVSRMRHAFALHSSADGRTWQLVRVCTLGVPIDEPVEVGFLAQSPNGAGCRAIFDDVTFTALELSDTRDGS
ncbi:DUF1349 domain-containing protein [Streptomyces sp. NPDC001137]|uniref:DUF1349 domain-containing protein n=1 Tax=Streptomyces sp. NPDC001137 TaxID=3154378 RepID=UPI003323D618